MSITAQSYPEWAVTSATKELASVTQSPICFSPAAIA